MLSVDKLSRPKSEKNVGLAYWMNRVLKEHSGFNIEPATELAHDLRVALRRCRVLAALMEGLDSNNDWKTMRKSARRLFRPMGGLRDVQVQMEGAERVAAALHLPAHAFLKELKARYEQERVAALQAMQTFDCKQWRGWAHKLPMQFRRLAADPAACKAIALAGWDEVHATYRRLQRTHSRIAYHRLRIEIKKLRYTVENLLPSLYLVWCADLMFLQEVLGEIHDRDVLTSTLARNKRFFDAETHVRWIQHLAGERDQLLEQLRHKMTHDSPIELWRDGLPSGKELKPAGLAQLALWARFASRHSAHARHVAKFALELYDSAVNSGLLPKDPGFDARFVLRAAALLQDVGRAKKGKPHHKASYRMIRRATAAVGWSKKELHLVACLVRFHKGALPHPDHKILRDYPSATRESLIALASLLRLANAFRTKHYRSVRSLRLETEGGVLVVRAEGYGASDRIAPKLNVAKHLLEFAFKRPVSILPLSAAPRPQLVRSMVRTHPDAA